MIDDLGDGIHRIPVPLPFRAPSAVNCYVFEGANGLTLLDVGVRDEAGRRAITDGLRAASFDDTDVSTIIGSHLHVDHIGGARRLVAELGAEFLMHHSTAASLPRYNDWATRTTRFAALVRAHGAPREATERLIHRWERPEWYDTAIPPTRSVGDLDRIDLGPDRHLQVIYTPGHQENHISLVDSRTGRWFSGDHILPRISPFIPHAGDDRDTLGDYLDSVRRVIDAEAESTLPGHGSPIEHGAARARQIRSHHSRRLQDVIDELAHEPVTGWEMMERIFRPNLSLGQQRLAIQETLAHLEHLRRIGRVEARLDDEVWSYRLR